MKREKITAVFVIIFILISITACGNKATDPSSQGSVISQSSSGQTDGQQTLVGQSIPSPDPKSDIETLLGTWTEINSPDRKATITKTDSGYQYEDNDGAYPAAFKDGVLKVQVSETETADVYYDIKSNHMLSVYQGEPSEFVKK